MQRTVAEYTLDKKIKKKVRIDKVGTLELCRQWVDICILNALSPLFDCAIGKIDWSNVAK